MELSSDICLFSVHRGLYICFIRHPLTFYSTYMYYFGNESRALCGYTANLCSLQCILSMPYGAILGFRVSNTWHGSSAIFIVFSARRKYPPLSDAHILDINPIGTAHLNTAGIQQNIMFLVLLNDI